jgi:hypothetical protein
MCRILQNEVRHKHRIDGVLVITALVVGTGCVSSASDEDFSATQAKSGDAALVDVTPTTSALLSGLTQASTQSNAELLLIPQTI